MQVIIQKPKIINRPFNFHIAYTSTYSIVYNIRCHASMTTRFTFTLRATLNLFTNSVPQWHVSWYITTMMSRRHKFLPNSGNEFLGHHPANKRTGLLATCRHRSTSLRLRIIFLPSPSPSIRLNSTYTYVYMYICE